MFKINYDALGIGVSLACAIHCAVLPLMLTSVPVFGTNIIDHAGFEIIMIGVAAIIGMIALWHGFKRHHHRYLPIIIFLIGITLLFTKQFNSLTEWIFLIPAVLLIISAHLMNYRLCRKANHCHSNDCTHK